MAKKSDDQLATESELLLRVRASLVARRPGYRPWHERLSPEHRRQLEQLREEWRAGRLGSQLRPVAAALVADMTARQISDIGVQGVSRWLAEKP